jgi:hypothetical protein
MIHKTQADLFRKLPLSALYNIEIKALICNISDISNETQTWKNLVCSNGGLLNVNSKRPKSK